MLPKEWPLGRGALLRVTYGDRRQVVRQPWWC
jgi:hypothetical protein